MSAEALPADNSYAALSYGNALRRRPRFPARVRPKSFAEAFDSTTLFYDCFWHADRQRILLVGPPISPADRRAGKLRFVAQPSDIILSAQFHPSLSTMVTELSGAPEFATMVRIEFAGETILVPIQPNSSAQLKGRKLLFTVNRDNELGWIREWAAFHARVHGTDAVIVFDNNSSRYASAEVLDTLLAVPGLAYAAVPSWPYSFGPRDPAVMRDPFWPRFLQIGAMSVVLRRYGEAAFGLLDCDIDELAGTRSGRSIYDLARRSRGGLVAFRGRWIESVGQGATHRDFTQRLAGGKRARSRTRKWALDPSRSWVRRLDVHPYWHWIEGRPMFSKTMPRDALYWHFRPINTDWKSARTTPPPAGARLVVDKLLAKSFERLAP